MDIKSSGVLSNYPLKFKRIVSTVSDGIVTLDTKGKYTFANTAAGKILGVSRDQIVGKSFNDEIWKLTTVQGWPLTYDENPFARTLQEQKGVFGFKLAVERPDGEKVSISINTSPLFDAAGSFDGMVGIFSDITDELELQARSNSFLHTVAHDLRVPLTVILGYAEILKDALREENVNGGVQSNINQILKSAEKMQKMIEDLVDSARLDTGQIYLKKEMIPLRDFVQTLIASSFKAADRKRLVIQMPEKLPDVLADPDRLERVFLNLISNALKFSPPESMVVLAANKSKTEVKFSVIDKGVGVSPENCAQIFKRYFQVEGSSRSKGIGLGLYISRLMIEAHDGRIWVESKLGEGSAFHFTLPTGSPVVRTNQSPGN